MSEERDIEKQLRAYADKRRKDAGGRFELHPATRRLLQGERQRVRGQGRAGETAAKSGGSRSFWPRLAWGVSMLAILAFGTWVYVRPQPKQPAPALAAKPESAGYVQSLAKNQTEPAPLALHTDSSLQNAAAEPMSVMTAAPAVSPAAPPPVEAEAVADRETDQAIKAKTMVAMTGDVAGGAAATRSDQPTSHVTDALAVQTATINLQQENKAQNAWSFSNVSPAKKALVADDKQKNASSDAAANQLLTTFHLEQNGNRVRIVDRDGSVYDGALLADTRTVDTTERRSFASAPAAAAPRMETGKELPALKDQNLVAQNFRFAAAGTNLSLRQRVTISGEFVAATNAVPGQMNAFSNQMLKANVQSGYQLSNGRITGRAVTTDGQQVELNATEVQMKE